MQIQSLMGEDCIGRVEWKCFPRDDEVTIELGMAGWDRQYSARCHGKDNTPLVATGRQRKWMLSE